MMNTRKIAIIGLGLIGGSLGLALKEAWQDSIIIAGYDQCRTTIDRAISDKVVDVGPADLAAAVTGAEVIFLCPPVLQIVPLVKAMLPYLRDGAIITDVGSTKKFLADKLKAILPPGISYVGGHPMAGREKSGLTAAAKDLFRDKWYILISSEPDNPAPAGEIIRTLLSKTGARITFMALEDHDRSAAEISHIPHIAAASLVNLLPDGEEQETELKLAGGGFKDTTRIASSDPDMWADICLTNGPEICRDIERLQGLLGNVIAAIDRGDREAIYQFFKTAKNKRDKIISG